MFWESVSGSLTANILSAIITIAIGILILITRRKALLRFWGIQDVKVIRIYISNLQISPGGALDAQGNPRSYQGSVVTRLESEMAGLIKSLFFAVVPGRVVQPNWVQSLMFVKADVGTRPAPAKSQQVDHEGTVISLGSPAYNDISGAIEVNCNSPVKFVNDYASIKLPGGLEITDSRQSVVVRLLNADKYCFYVAGLSEEGTASAAYYLAKSWRRLHRLYHDSPSFFVVLEFSGNDYRNTRILSEARL